MFTQDTRTESYLTSIGVKYRFVDDLKIDELPPDWNRTNHGRRVSVCEDAVVQYGALMESGSAAPAVILRETSAGALAVLDGLQRLSAAKMAGFSRFSAYVVATDSEDVAEAIRVTANARLQGHAEPPEWTKRNAVQRLMIDRNMSAKDVASMGGWKTADLVRMAKVLEWGVAIRNIGGPANLADGLVQKVAASTSKQELQKAHKPIAAFLQAITKARFSVDDAAPYIEEFFRPAAKPTIYATRLEEFYQEPEVDTRLHGRQAPALGVDVKLRRALRGAVTILDEAISAGEQMQYVDEFYRLLRKLEKQLETIAPKRRRRQ